MNEREIEIQSLRDLEKIIKEIEKWHLKLVIIGGYAVRAYTRGYRYTKDIDIVAEKKETGRLIALLKSLGYIIKETRFGLSGSKKLNSGFIDLHISIGEVWDMSTNKRYPIVEIFKDSKIKEVSGFSDDTRKIKIKAFVSSLGDLLILKLMTKGRERDIVDIASLLIDKYGCLDLKKFSLKCSRQELSMHIKENILKIIALVRTHELGRIWFRVTGQKLMRKTETELIGKLKEMGKMI